MTAQRILIVGLNYAPEPVGIGPYTQGLAEALAADGRAVEVICGQPYYPQWQRYSGYARGWRATSENGVEVLRCPHFVPTDPGGTARIAHLASFALAALPQAMRIALRGRSRRPQLVIAVVPALPAVLAGWLAARIARAKLWIHVQDFEAEAAVATGLLRADGATARMALGIERRILALADRVSTIGPQMAKRLVAKGIEQNRIRELRNWADPRFAPDPSGAEELRREWGLSGKTVALYSGNIARKQGIEVLIEAARLLAGREDLALVICGEGPNRTALEQRAAGLANLQIRDLQPADRMGALLAMADLHLLPQIAGAADLVLPSKLTNMLASARPVVATTDPGTGLWDEVEGCGILTPPGMAASLAEAIRKLADDPPLRQRLGEAAARRAAERWSKQAILANWQDTLDDLAQSF